MRRCLQRNGEVSLSIPIMGLYKEILWSSRGLGQVLHKPLYITHFHLELESPVTGSGQRSRSAPWCILKRLALGFHYLQADHPLVLVFVYSSAFLLEGPDGVKGKIVKHL